VQQFSPREHERVTATLYHSTLSRNDQGLSAPKRPAPDLRVVASTDHDGRAWTAA